MSKKREVWGQAYRDHLSSDPVRVIAVAKVLLVILVAVVLPGVLILHGVLYAFAGDQPAGNWLGTVVLGFLFFGCVVFVQAARAFWRAVVQYIRAEKE